MTMQFVPTQDQIDAALAHAQACAPLESCGFIVGGAFVPVKNVITDHPDHFVMDRKAYTRYVRDAEAIVHSHIGFPAFASEMDRASCNASGLPWVIVSLPSQTWCVVHPDGQTAPLVGRDWRWGVYDCYSLIRDALRIHTGIIIPDYERDWEFWKNDDMISRLYAENGFRALPKGTKPRSFDLFGMRCNSTTTNHLALFWEPDQILHQLYRRNSVRELYDGPWQQRTLLHLRHERFA